MLNLIQTIGKTYFSLWTRITNRWISIIMSSGGSTVEFIGLKMKRPELGFGHKYHQNRNILCLKLSLNMLMLSIWQTGQSLKQSFDWVNIRSKYKSFENFILFLWPGLINQLFTASNVSQKYKVETPCNYELHLFFYIILNVNKKIIFGSDFGFP